MSENYKEISRDVFDQTLENLAFLFAESIETEEVDLISENCQEVRMSFSGEFSGNIYMVVQDDFCSELAANILGISDEEEDAFNLGIDSLKEVLNVVCGRILTEIAGTKPLFNLSVPEVNKINTDDINIFLDYPETVAFLVDDMYPVMLRFCKDD